MVVIPHAYWLFDSVGLLLRCDSEDPDQEDTTWEMPPEEARRYVATIGSYIASSPRDARLFPHPISISLLGGEPLAQPDALESILVEAQEYGMVGDVWSTASWVSSYDHAVERLARFRGRMHAVRLHTNATLLEKVGLTRVDSLLNAARTVGIAIYVRFGIGPHRPLPRSLLELEVINSDSSFLHPTPIYDDIGDLDIASSDYYMQKPSRQRCAEKLGLYVVPGGDVYPCLPGVGIERLRIGSLATQTMPDLMGEVLSNQGLASLRLQGPRPLFDKIAASTCADLLKPRYLDPCDFHRDMLRTPALVAFLDEGSDPRPAQGGQP